MKQPASRFEYDLPEYAHLGHPAQWSLWLGDVQRFIAEQYGIDPNDRDEQASDIVHAGYVVWYRDARLIREGWGDTPHGYEWLETARERLAAAIENRQPAERDYRAEFYAAHPEYAEREAAQRVESAQAAGRLF